MIDEEASCLSKRYLKFDIFFYMEYFFFNASMIYFNNPKIIQQNIHQIENFGFKAMQEINNLKTFLAKTTYNLKYLTTSTKLKKLYNMIYLYMAKYVAELHDLLLIKNKSIST